MKRLCVSLVMLGLATAGCSQSSTTNPSALPATSSSTDIAPGAVTNQLVAELRAATAKYHRLEAALADGYIQLSGCVELPGVGGMGFHYGRPPFDASVSAGDPEVLVYAPNHGHLKLVAAEFIVPQALSATPPTLFGQTFHVNPAIGSWILHAWVWEVNPAGIFEDWNPRISCSD